MSDVASVRCENESLRKVRERLLLWDVKDNALAPLTNEQQDAIDILTQAIDNNYYNLTEEEKDTIKSEDDSTENDNKLKEIENLKTIPSESLQELLMKSLKDGDGGCIETTQDFLFLYDKVNNELHDNSMDIYIKFFNELKSRKNECDEILKRTEIGIKNLNYLKSEYEFVSNKTSSLNIASEKLLREQNDLNNLCIEINRRLRYFKQAEQLSQRLQSPTLSVASDNFKECLNEIDTCLDYLMQNPKFKESSSYIIKYKHCLSKALTLMRNYVTQILIQTTEQILTPSKVSSSGLAEKTSSEAAFALYYGKFHSTAVKVKRISSMIEERCSNSKTQTINPCSCSSEYEQLLSELHQCYLSYRANVMSPAVDNSIKNLKSNNKGDYCTLIRSSCAFLVHVCQDEYRLFYQFFSLPTDQLNSYLEGLCTMLYDTLRPYIIHINHLETLAEICSILKVEMIEEHVQQNPESLEAFGKILHQLLQDVQERLVFRAHLYLQSDILNYNPSAGDLAYPEKLEMMESIALSLQEPPMLRRSDSRSSVISTASSAVQGAESVDSSATAAFRGRSMNSPADLHGMWYPTVRRTLVCLSRLYRCVDRPIFQGLSQEALKYCIQSVSSAAAKISATKTPIDGELFEIKHLLILREQIAPFRVDFIIKETSLDFSKIKTAAFSLLHKRKQLFSFNSNNAILEFLLEGTPEVKEQLIDSRKDVDRQLKTICEKFINDSVKLLIDPILKFLDKAQNLLQLVENQKQQQQQQQQQQQKNDDKNQQKINYSLRQSPWASPQQISSYIQESQRNIKNKLSGLQRSMQLYLSNRDTEFIIFRPIRNNIITAFVKLEQLLTVNGYTKDDLIITSCPSAEQVSVLLSSASLMASTQLSHTGGPSGPSGANSENVGASRKISTSSVEGGTIAGSIQQENKRKFSTEKKVSFDESSAVPTTTTTTAAAAETEGVQSTSTPLEPKSGGAEKNDTV